MSSHFKSAKCLTNNHQCEEKIVYCLLEKYLHLVNTKKTIPVVPRREFLLFSVSNFTMVQGVQLKSIEEGFIKKTRLMVVASDWGTESLPR